MVARFAFLVTVVPIVSLASAQQVVPRAPDLVYWGALPPQGDPMKDRESWHFRNRQAYGFVQSVGKDAITLYWPAGHVLTQQYDPTTGTDIGPPKKENLPAVSAKKFLLDHEFAQGGHVPPEQVEWTYRVTDLKVGDRVRLRYDRRNGWDYACHVCIDRRPGGLVPSAPGEDPNAFRKYHERANAEQQWEEKRTPYPQKYWPTYLGPDGLFYRSPYPSESTKIVPVPAPKS